MLGGCVIGRLGRMMMDLDGLGLAIAMALIARMARPALMLAG